MNPIHFAFAGFFPTPGPHFSLARLFWLLDRFDVRQRQEVLEAAYFCLDCGEHAGDHWREQWYQSFKKALSEAGKSYRDEAFAVYGLLSYVLARALQKCDVCRFARLIEDKEQLIKTLSKPLEGSTPQKTADDDGDAMDAAGTIEAVKGGIMRLHKELEYCKLAYDAFCEKVVRPLLEGPEELTFSGPPPSVS